MVNIVVKWEEKKHGLCWTLCLLVIGGKGTGIGVGGAGANAGPGDEIDGVVDAHCADGFLHRLVQRQLFDDVVIVPHFDRKYGVVSAVVAAHVRTLEVR